MKPRMEIRRPKAENRILKGPATPGNPKGIASLSPGLRAASYPGFTHPKNLQPCRGCITAPTPFSPPSDIATNRRFDLPLLLWRRGPGRGGRHTGKPLLHSSAIMFVPLSPTLSPRFAGGEREKPAMAIPRSARDSRSNPFRVEAPPHRIPRVARASQPWAECSHPFRMTAEETLGWAADPLGCSGPMHWSCALPIANRRYGRLKICATCL